MSQTSYTSRSRTYLTQATEELAKGDLCQASEKGWGAAAEIVKAVAASRGWEHGGHRDLFDVVDRLVIEARDEDIRGWFLMAGQLHTNFYEGWLSEAAIEATLDRVTRFVERMESLVTAERTG